MIRLYCGKCGCNTTHKYLGKITTLSPAVDDGAVPVIIRALCADCGSSGKFVVRNATAIALGGGL